MKFNRFVYEIQHGFDGPLKGVKANSFKKENVDGFFVY